MRSGLSIVVAFILITSILDAEGSERSGIPSPDKGRDEAVRSRYAIEFREEIRFRALNEDLAETCGSPGKVRGCTEFPLETLECDCYRDGAGWRLSIEARVDAVMHVDHTTIVVHERRHLFHLDDLLSAWLDKMTTPVFATEARCRAVGRLLSRPQYVTAMMNDLRMSSNQFFQCSRPGATHPEGLLAFEVGTRSRGEASAR